MVKKKGVVKIKGTEIIVILDRSGSMQMIKSDTIGGFNQFLKEQKKIKDDTKMTMVQFDHEYDFVYQGVMLNEVKKLNDSTFIPRGTTSLYDAIGRTIGETESRLDGKDRNVVFMIITDGEENSSREYHSSQIKELVEAKTKLGWNFMYLGANQDAITAARSFGVSRGMSATYTANAQGTKALYGTMSTKMSSYRSVGDAQALSFKDDERDDLMDKK